MSLFVTIVLDGVGIGAPVGTPVRAVKSGDYPSASESYDG